jgi:plasmid maintenance system antidote protein VapI/Zn-dependent peptidase ImmA (M78 family)
MRTKQMFAYEPDYAVPPGETVREQMEHYGWTQQELAVRLNTTPQTLNRIFKGEQVGSLDMANRLELVLGAPAKFWNNLELNYRERLAKLEEKRRLASDLAWLKTIPVRELVARGVIEDCEERTETLRRVLAFYGVSNVQAWHALWACPEVAARRSTCFESQPGAASAWIRLGEIQAQECSCKAYDKANFVAVLDELRGRIGTPDSTIPYMRDQCAACGVALSLVPEMPKAPWSGATKWLSPDKVMILLNLRGKAEDKFWFSFYHEAGHVLHDSKKDLLINDGSSDDPRELRANTFAAEQLIPAHYNDRIRRATSDVEIKRLALEIGVSPGIVAGRYQYLTHQWHRFKSLIRTYKWAENHAS